MTDRSSLQSTRPPGQLRQSAREEGNTFDFAASRNGLGVIINLVLASLKKTSGRQSCFSGKNSISCFQKTRTDKPGTLVFFCFCFF